MEYTRMEYRCCMDDDENAAGRRLGADPRRQGLLKHALAAQTEAFHPVAVRLGDALDEAHDAGEVA